MEAEKRPDLTYLTQRKFSTKESSSLIFVVDKSKEIEVISYWDKIDRNCEFCTAFSKLPELVQIAEMFFDMTESNPNSISHQLVKNLLNELKQ